MLMANFKDEEMSMEDILSSIRKYVAEEDNSKQNPHATDYPAPHEGSNSNPSMGLEDNVITLEQEDVADTSDRVPTSANVDNTQDHFDNLFNDGEGDIKNSSDNELHKNISSPFNKLAEALKTYGKHKRNSELNLDMSVEQFFRTVIENYLQKWMNANLNRMVEDIIKREIDRLKSE